MKGLYSLLFASVVYAAGGVHASAQMKPKPVYNHSAYYVADLKVSTDFYKEVIGLEQVAEPFHDGRHSWFSLGKGTAGKLHIISGAKEKTAHDKNTHFCFSYASLDEMITRLKSRRIPYENWAGEQGQITKRVDGVQQIYFKDPDGYWIEVNNEPGAFK